ncbi:MAG: hypothetical protein ABSD20_08105 [Terriglobales bacterium]
MVCPVARIYRLGVEGNNLIARNPWGDHSSQTGGVFELPMTDLTAMFQVMSTD